MRVTLFQSKFVLFAPLLAIAFAARASAVAFTPTQNQLDNLKHAEIIGPIGTPPIVNSETDDPAGGIDINLTFPTGGHVAFSFTYPASPATDLSAFKSFDLEFTKTNTNTLVSVQTFIQDRTANFTTIMNPSASSLVLVNDFLFDLTDSFNQGAPPFDPTNILDFGFTLFGDAGTTATIRVVPLPEPASFAAIGLMFATISARRRLR